MNHLQEKQSQKNQEQYSEQKNSGFLLKYIPDTTIIPKELYIYIICIVLHFISPHIYIKFCIPNTLLGMIMSPFMLMTPQCQILRWISYYSGYTINHMWILLASWLLRTVVDITKFNFLGNVFNK